MLLKKNTEFLVLENKEDNQIYCQDSENLLDTIKLPKNLKNLKEKLPKP